MTAIESYIDHIAIYVSDINWHTRFFNDVFGMSVLRIEGDEKQPEQVWLKGGLQLISNFKFDKEGRFAHIGIAVSDLDCIKAKSDEWGFKELDNKPNWIVLHNGLIIELMLKSNLRGV